MSRIPPIATGVRRTQLAGLVANGLGQALITVGSAALVHRFFDQVFGAEAAPRVSTAAVLALGLLVAAMALARLRMLERVQAETLGQNYAAELRLALFDHLSTLPVRSLLRRSRGATLLRFIGDVRGVRRWISLGLPRLAVGALCAAVALAALAWASLPMTLAAALGFGAGTAALGWLTGRIEPAVREARRRQARLAANVNDKIGGIGVLQVFDQVERERQRIKQQGERLSAAMIEQMRGTAALRSTAEFVGGLASALVLLAGTLQVGRGAASPADVAAAIAIVALIAPHFRDLGQALGYWKSARVSMERIAAFLAAPGMALGEPGAELQRGSGTLEFRGVSFADALCGVSALAPAGKRVAIVGPNGSGKSTLLALAAQLARPDAGEILLDGQPVTSASTRSVRRALGVVCADLPLLRGTIEENLRYRWPEAPVEELKRVRSLCSIDEMLAALPKGGQTRVADGGGNLSFGQRQRIAWARALLGSPTVLLLDEADANLDPGSAGLFDRMVAAFPGTVLMVTQDGNRVMKADFVWYLEGGRLLELGTPAELMGGATRTRRLFLRESSLAG